MAAALQPTSIASLPPGTMLPGSHQVAAAAAAAAAAVALSRPGMFSQIMQPPVSQSQFLYSFICPSIRSPKELFVIL